MLFTSEGRGEDLDIERNFECKTKKTRTVKESPKHKICTIGFDFDLENIFHFNFN
jgi:hypothetical protein